MPAQPEKSIETRTRGRSAAVLLALVATAGLSTGMALAASSSPTLKSARNSKLGQSVVVASNNRTVYALSPETRSHLLCTSSQCMQVWPPYTVKSKNTKLRAGKGVNGKLGLLRRSNGKFQVTLGGLPLYRFAGDTASGQANGNGINSFGGHWHVIKASASGSSTPAPAGSMTPTTTTSTPSYTPPGY